MKPHQHSYLSIAISLALAFIFLFGIIGVGLADSNSGNALDFDGTADYVTLGSEADFDFTSAFSVEAWFRVDTFSTNWQAIVTKGDSAWAIHRYSNTNTLAFSTTGLSNVDLQGTTNVNDGQWHHVAAVYDGSTKYLYVDGYLDASVSVTGALSTNNFPVEVGENAESTGRYFNGYTDEVRIWNDARTADEIRDNLYKELTGTEANLVAYYQFNETSGTTADNAEGTVARDGTLTSMDFSTNGAPSGAFSGPRNALDFDGADDFVAMGTVSTTIGSSWQTTKTVSLWVKPTGTAPVAAQVTGGDLIFGDHPRWFGMYQANIGGQDRIWVMNHDNNNPDGEVSFGITYTVGTWIHITLVHQNSTLSAYRNGVLVGSAHSGPTASWHQAPGAIQLRIGGRFTASDGNHFQGVVDEVQVWSIGLTQAQVRDNMMHTLAGNESGLAIYYRMDYGLAGGTNTSLTNLYDVTANNNDGTLTNFALSGSTSNWVASSAYNTWIGNESTNWATAGNWSRNAVPGAGENVGIYGYTGGNSATLTTTASISNTLVATGGALILPSNGTLSVSGNLLNNGTITQTQTVTGSTDVGFFQTGNYGGVTLNANGLDLGSTVVAIRGNQDCTSTSGETVTRCFNITPTNTSGRNATITFFFDNGEIPAGQSCSTMDVYHHNGITWGPETRDLSYGTNGRLCGSDPQSVRITGVSDFSPFVLKTTTPTAITLNTFQASSEPNNRTVLGGGLAILLGLCVAGMAILNRLRHGDSQRTRPLLPLFSFWYTPFER